MSHGLINSRDFQVGEEQAWHKLTEIGIPSRDRFPLITAQPLRYMDSDGNNWGASHGENSYVIPISQDDGLPVAPPYCQGTYSLFTPREGWDFVMEVLSGTDFKVESIGMIWNRSRWFISTKLTELESFSVGDNDQTNFQLNFSGGLDRTLSPQAELSGTRIVCQNTLSLSRSTGTVLFNEKATKNFKSRLEAAKNEMEKAVGMAAVFSASMKTISETPCSVKRARNIYAGFITPKGVEKMSSRTSNTVTALEELFVGGLGNKGETEYDLLNGYTQLLSRGDERIDTRTKKPLSTVSVERTIISSQWGDSANKKAEFCNLLIGGDDQRGILNEIESRGVALLSKN